MPSPYEERRQRGGAYAEMRQESGGGAYGAAAQSEPGPPSLFSQFKGLVGALPEGITHMGADVAQDAYGLTQLPSAVSLAVLANLPGPGASMVRGLHRNRYLRPFVGEEMVIDAANGAGFSDNMRNAFPFMASVGTSMRHTGERLVNQTAALAPGGLPAGEGAYARASKEGAILPVLVEDIGNAALVAQGASSLTGRAAESATTRAGTAEAAAQATQRLGTGGATAAEVAPRIAPRPLTAPVEAARVFEVGGAGPAATSQVIDEAAATAAREAADAAAARAIRLQRVSRGLHTAARLGDTAADAPARVFTAPLGFAARRIGPAARTFLESPAGARVASFLDEKVTKPWQQHLERSGWRTYMHETGQLPMVEGSGRRIGAGVRAMRLVDSPEEGAASHMVVSGVADALGPWLDEHAVDLADQMGVSPDEARRWAIEQFIPDETEPGKPGYDRVAAFDIARRYSEGTLEPEAVARMDAAQDLLRTEVREPRQSWFRRGRGEQKLPTPEKIQGRQEQFGNEPLSIVVRNATERIDAKIEAQVRKVIAARERAEGADRRRILDPEGYKASVRESVAAIYAEAQDVAAAIVRDDPEMAAAAAGINGWTPSTEQLIDILAGRLVSARGSRNPVLRSLVQDLKAAGYEVPFDLPNPAMFIPAERRAAGAERARIFERQAEGAEGTAATAQRQLEDWQGQPQPIVGARPGATSTLERRAVSADRAARAAAEGPAAPDTEGLDLTIDPDTPVSSVGEWVDWTQMQGGDPTTGTPGSIEEVPMPRPNGAERTWFAYDDAGRPVGYIDVQIDPDGTPTALSVAVDEAAQGRGIGMRLYDAVADAGIDVDRALANETFTPAGARLYERWRGRRGLFSDPVRRGVYERARAREEAAAQRGVPSDSPELEPIDINDPELATDLATVTSRVRRAADDVQAQIIVDLDFLYGGAKIAPPPRRRSFGKGGHEGGGEWDWYDALPEPTRAVIRRRWTEPDGPQPDQMALNYYERSGRDVSPEEAAREWVKQVEIYEAIGRIRKGYATPADLDLAGASIPDATRGELEAVGLADVSSYDVMSRKGGPPRKLRSASRRHRASRERQLERLGQHRAEQLAQERLGPEPPVARDGRLSAWEMPVEQYAAELSAAEDIVARAADENPVNNGLEDDVWVEPADVAAARTRVGELAPSDFDDPANPVAPEVLHARLVQAAQAHGFSGAPEGDAGVFDPAGAGAAAVVDIEQRALEAFIEDLENRQVAKLSGQQVPSEDLLYNTLNEPGRRLYRQMVRDVHVIGEDQRLDLARRQLEQKLIGRGRRAQAPISRQQGRLEARERILTTAAEQARRRADTAADRLDEAASRYEVRTTGVERGMSGFARGQRRLGEREGAARVREADVGREERTLARLMDRRARAVQEARLSPEAAPARFGTELRSGGDLRSSIEEQAEYLDDDIGPGAGDLLRTLAEDIPANLYDALALEGYGAAPEHLIGGSYSRRKGGSGVGRLDESAPYRRKAGQERIKSRTGGETLFSIEGQVREEVKRFRDSVRNDLAHRMEAEFGVHAEDFGLEDLRGQPLVDAMEAKGYVPWDPANPVGRGTPPPGQVSASTTFISQNASDAFGRVFGDRSRLQQLLETWYDRRFLGTVKTGWLALSPRWLVGNVVGNAMMAVIGGGVDPVTLVRQMGNARALLAEDPSGRLLERQERVRGERGDIPRPLLNRGFTHEEMTFLNPELDKPVRNPVARIAARSYQINEFTDNVFRSAVYLAKIEPRQRLWADVESGAITGQEFASRVRDTLGAKAALESALHAAGDFQNMSTFERSVIKRLWIFYPWYRHITRLALSLPINHPTRTLWTLHVAQLWGNEQEQTELPPFLRGSIPLGNDRYVPTGPLNPFGQIEDSPLLSPSSAVAGLTPAITWPAAILMGVDVTRGFEDISRPPGTEKLDVYGRPRNTPLWGNFGELARWTASQFPQGRAFLGATEDPVLRYGQGSPVLVNGETVPSGRSRGGAVAQVFGIPFPMTVDTAAIAQRRNERTAAANTARERYYENLRYANAGR